jgi:hypothetical protein
MSTADLRKIGSIGVLDLDIVGRFYGRDFLPYPFMFTRPSRFSWHDEYVEYARSVPDRFHNGDLRMFQECAGSYASADIRVECHVQYIPADTPSVRVLAVRRDRAGFLAKQRPDEDVVDVYELAAYLLGPAVAESVALEKPGRRPAIVIPGYAPITDAGASEEFTPRHTIEGAPSATEVPSAEVAAFGTVQSHWRPTRRWGIDAGKNAAVWIRIKDDGEYLYQPDFSEARPMSRPVLADRIDRLISEDVTVLRQFRNG